MSNAKDFVIENDILKKYIGQEQNITIPNGITKIGKNAFGMFQDRFITKITIPEGVTEIGEYAFEQLQNLVEINIPSTVVRIGKYAFAYCSSLTSLEIPEATTQIGEGAFFQCDKIVSMRLPEGLEQLSKRLFSFCYRLTQVNIPEKITVIPEEAFNFCALSDARLPAGVTRIERGAFCGCKGLKEINIPQGCTVEPRAFGGCNGLVDGNGLLIYENRLMVHYLGEHGSFPVILPDTVETIERGAIEGYGQRHVEMNICCPQWEVYGEAKAYGFAESFIGCHGSTISFRDDTGKIVAKVVLATEGETEPKTNGAILSICQKNHAFDFAGYDAYWAKLAKNPNKIRVALVRLQYPYVLSDEMREVYETFLTKQSLNTGKLLVDEDNLELLSMLAEKQLLSKTALPKLIDYANEQGKSAITAMLLMQQHTAAEKTTPKKPSKPKAAGKPMWKAPKPGTHLIGRYIGTDTEVEFPLEFNGIAIDGIANSAGSVPENYKNITSVIIPEGYTTIGNRTFAGCERLERISLPSTLQSVGIGAFAGCTGLKEVYWPAGITCKSAFADAKIQTAVLEGNGTSPFYQCSIENLVILSGKLKAKRYLFVDAYTWDRFPAHIWINGQFDCLELRERGSLARRVHPLSDFNEQTISDEKIRNIVSADKKRRQIPGVTNLLMVTQKVEAIDFKDSTFVYSGFPYGNEEFVHRMIENRGGKVEQSITSETRYVVVPDGDCVKTEKYAKALSLQKKGADISVVSFSEMMRHAYSYDKDLYGEEGAALLQKFDVSISEKEVVLKYYFGNDSTLVIPEKLGKCSIIRIDNGCFHNYADESGVPSLTKITVPNSIELEPYCFYGSKPEVIRK